MKQRKRNSGKSKLTKRKIIIRFSLFGRRPERGRSPVEHRGNLSVRPSVRPPQALSGLKSALSGLKSALSGLESALSGLKSSLSGLKSVLSGLESERAEFRPERADFNHEKA